MNCTLCETRRPRRYCPGVRGEICAPCCGTSREVSVDCPLDCEYLRQAREHERLPEADADEVPNADIKVDQRFLAENEPLLAFGSIALFQSALETPGAVDQDVREALDALIRTYRTRSSGLYYNTLPTNPIAAAILEKLEHTLEEYRKKVHERTGLQMIRDSEILGILVLLQRLERSHSNGRRRGRAFLGFLHDTLDLPNAQPGPARGPAPLIV